MTAKQSLNIQQVSIENRKSKFYKISEFKYYCSKTFHRSSLRMFLAADALITQERVSDFVELFEFTAN